MENVFDNLSQSLSRDERAALLERISVSLNLAADSDTSIIHKPLDQEDKKKKIRQDLSRLGPALQLQLWITSFFSPKSIEERFIRLRINQMIRKIHKVDDSLIDGDGEYIGAGFASRVEILQQYARKLKTYYASIWNNPDVIPEIAAGIASRHIPEAKEKLTDFLPRSELKILVYKQENSGKIREQLDSKMKDYLDSVHIKVFDIITEELSPLYFLKSAVEFPYDKFLAAFKGKDGYHGARFQSIRDDLEHLYYSVYVATRWEAGRKIDSILTQGNETIAQQIVNFYHALKDFFFEVPLAEIIKAGTLDPYYRFMIYVPRIDVKRFLGAYLRLHVFAEFDAVITECRIETASEMLSDLFRAEWKNPLQHIIDFQRMEGTGSEHVHIHRTHSVGMIYLYLKTRFPTEHEGFALAIAKTQTRRIGQVGSDMLMVLSNLDDIMDKIDRVNISLSSDASEGEDLRRLRLLSQRDPSIQRQYRMKLEQIDKRAYEYSTRFLDTLISLRSQFVSYHVHIEKGRSGSADKLKKEIEWLQHFVEALRLVMQLEDEKPREIYNALNRGPGSIK
ncbi:DUF5312 family protein [Spirochaeta dissipatitropha]